MIPILKKCLDELNKDSFRKDYVVGMLETLVEIQEANVWEPVTEVSKDTRKKISEFKEKSFPMPPSTDDAAILDAKARASLQTIKALADKSTE